MKWISRILPKLVPSRWLLGKLFWGTVATSLLVLAFCLGRYGSTRAVAKTPDLSSLKHPASFAKASPTDYDRRVVAYIYGNRPITREDLGEFLIERFGPAKVELLVNRRIVELECEARGVSVTSAEVEAKMKEDLGDLSKGGAPINLKAFEDQILKRFNKSLLEWKEDVIRPKLALTKLARSMNLVRVTDKDLEEAYEARYGPKVQCRMIVMGGGPEQRNHWFKTWEEVKKSEEAFRTRARTQYIEALAYKGGEVPPIHRHFGDPRLEKEAFSLKEGEVGTLIELPDGTAVILKCDKHIPADGSVRFSEARPKLFNSVYEFKLNQKIPQLFQELRRRAAPTILLTGNMRQDDLERDALRELNPKKRSEPVAPIPPPPSGGGLTPVPPGSAIDIPDLGTTLPPTTLVSPPPGSVPTEDAQAPPSTPAPAFEELTAPPAETTTSGVTTPGVLKKQGN